MNTIKIIISARSIILAFIFLFLAWLVYATRDVLLFLFASFVIASALYPVVDWLDKRMPRGLAVTLVYLGGFIVLATVFIPFFSILVDQIQEFFKQIPIYWESSERFIRDWKINTRNIGILPDISQIISNSANIGENIVSQSINITIAVFTGIIALFTLALIVLFLLLDKKTLKDGFLRLFPENIREKTEEILITISLKVGGYVRGLLLLMLSVGIMTAIGLYIIGVDFALLLGLLAAILEIIPVAGPTLAAVPAVIIALAKDPWLALWTILVYLIVQRIENNVLAPIILGKFLDLHPLIIIIALLIAASTLGVIGVILAPALAAAIYVLIQELYFKRINPENKQNIIEAKP